MTLVVKMTTWQVEDRHISIQFVRGINWITYWKKTQYVIIFIKIFSLIICFARLEAFWLVSDSLDHNCNILAQKLREDARMVIFYVELPLEHCGHNNSVFFLGFPQAWLLCLWLFSCLVAIQLISSWCHSF